MSNHEHFYGICENKCLVEIEHDNIPGTVPVENGGTGATTASDALSNLGITAAASELNYLEGVTSNVQTQLGNKANKDLTNVDNTVFADKAASAGGTGFKIGKASSTGEIFNNYTTNVASGYASHAEGDKTTASGYASHATGYNTTASGENAVATGSSTVASGRFSFASGWCSQAKDWCSSAFGDHTITNGAGQMAIGYYNKSTSNAYLVIGNGSSESARSNAFRVTDGGVVYSTGAYNTSGADYAEMWEIEGGNPSEEDLRGLFVTVNENNKITIAKPDDYILGIISATPSAVGDVHSEEWHDMYLKDVFGEYLTETVEVEETTDEFGYVTPAHTETRQILNPDYDSSKEYISRDERPEWAAVGLLGKLIVIDDGSCKPGQFCKVAEGGIATASSNGEGYRVLERKDDSHIKILFR